MASPLAGGSFDQKQPASKVLSLSAENKFNSLYTKEGLTIATFPEDQIGEELFLNFAQRLVEDKKKNQEPYAGSTLCTSTTIPKST